MKIGSLFSGSGMLDEGVRAVLGGEVAAEATQGFGGFLRCETCRAEEPLGDTTRHYRSGWPRCCGQTMRWWTQRQIDAGEVPE